MNIEALYKLYLKHPSVQTDTRKLKPGDIFFALRGPSFNGNEFAEQALDAGGSYAVIDEKKYEVPGKTILVEDALVTLQQLSKHHREQFNIPFLAITGSNGKTTTKELIYTFLSTTYTAYTTEGNLNNHIGIPLTLLKVKADAEIVVVEMGANHQKEIEGYCTYCQPTHGLITNIGKAHLEGFGSVEGVRKGKGELFDFLRVNKGSAFVMWDYDYLRVMSKGIEKIITYGTLQDSQIKGEIIQSEPFLHLRILKGATPFTIHTQLVGEYNLPNVLAAVAVGLHFKVTPENIKKSIENYIPSNSRSQLIMKGTNKIILDAYNANPSSMKAALENFAKLHSENKVLMLGAMAELGKESLEEHKALLELIKQYNWKDVVLVGGDFKELPHPFKTFENATQAKDWFLRQGFENSTFLIKGSRSMQMEKIVEA